MRTISADDLRRRLKMRIEEMRKMVSKYDADPEHYFQVQVEIMRTDNLVRIMEENAKCSLKTKSGK